MPPPQRVLICGSRNFPLLNSVKDYIATLPRDTIVISGGAHGVDSVAAGYATARGMKVEVYKANWERDGKVAGFLRNSQMLEVCDRVVAFWHSGSKGTLDTITKAKFKKIPLIVYATEQVSEGWQIVEMKS